jgi:16S rRNA (uracil1498-N3)-methyltransferase
MPIMAQPPRFFCPILTDDHVDLSSEEAHHARTVLRLRVGDEAIVFDGQGTEARGRLNRVSRQQVSLTLHERVHVPYEFHTRLTLAVAMPRAPRQHILFEKCSEIGVDAVWPVEFERSVARPGHGIQTRGQRTALEAARQARRAWVPSVEAPQSFATALGRAESFDRVVVLTPLPEAAPLVRLLAANRAGQRLMVWIGPEGGLTEEELASARQAGAQIASLGPTILRIETAAIVTAALVAAIDSAGLHDHTPGS